MCGIAGFCLAPGDESHATDVAWGMLKDIEHRGYDATGSAYINENKKFKLHKRNVDATNFLKGMGLNLCSSARVALLHTRYATKGDPSERGNNHPIHRGDIVLTHNGHVSNDDDLFRRLRVARRAQVDSESVAALLAFTQEDYHPTEVLPAIRGTAALAWFDFKTGRDTLHLARVTSSPLHVGQTTSGSFLYASTLEAIRGASFMLGQGELEWEMPMEEGEYMKIKDGIVAEYMKFNRNCATSFGPAKRNSQIADDESFKLLTSSATVG